MATQSRTIGSKNKRYLTGDVALDKALRELKMTASRRAVQQGMRKSAQFAAKTIKARIPSRYKGVRKAIGWRSLKLKETGGEPIVKVGASVGRGSKASVKNRDKKRPGVGIDGRNVHWWFLGTKKRHTGSVKRRNSTKLTGNRRRYTGSMPAQSQPIHVILGQYKGTMFEILRTWTAVGIKKEVAKLKAKI